MAGLIDNRQDGCPAERMELFRAGVLYMQGGDHAFAYCCFARIGKNDLHTLYNKALCCYRIGWFEECRLLLLEAERELPSGADTGLRELPEPFVRWEQGRNAAFSPMAYGTPPPLAVVQTLKLKAANAYRLGLYGEVKATAARLGGRYAWLNELTKKIDDGEV